MATPSKPKRKPDDKIEIEPGADKRLANILKKALNTPPRRTADPVRKSDKQTKPR